MMYRLRDEPCVEDCAAVRRIVSSTGLFHAAEIQVAVELVEERLARGLTSGYHFLFLDCSGDTVAYSCFGPIACTLASFDLYWIAVAREHQAAGLGRRLLIESEQRIAALGGQRIYVETSGRAQYDGTRAFYEHCGYRAEASLADFYAPGDPKVIYVKAVK